MVRQIVVVDDDKFPQAAAIAEPTGRAGTADDTAPATQAALFPPDVPYKLSPMSRIPGLRSGTGWKPGTRLQSKRDDRIYQVDDHGTFRRLTPKPASKKARRRMRRFGEVQP